MLISGVIDVAIGMVFVRPRRQGTAEGFQELGASSCVHALGSQSGHPDLYPSIPAASLALQVFPRGAGLAGVWTGTYCIPGS